MKRIILLVAIALLIAAVIGYYQYNKPHREASGEAFVSIQATELFSLFTSNEEQANENYLDKIIEVTGVISSVTLNQHGDQVLVLESNDPMFGVSCTLTKSKSTFIEGDNVRLKGFCRGYLSDVVLTDCVVVHHQTGK